MIVSVFGLRDFKGREYANYQYVSEVLDTFRDSDEMITGGGRGIEQLALRFASEHGIAHRVIPPNIQKFGSSVAFTKRNQEIIKASDVSVVFWDGEDRFYIDVLRTVNQHEKVSHVVCVK